MQFNVIQMQRINRCLFAIHRVAIMLGVFIVRIEVNANFFETSLLIKAKNFPCWFLLGRGNQSFGAI